MKSSTIIWIVVVIVVLLAGWYFFMMPQAAVAPVTTTQTGTTVNTNPTGTDYTPGNLLLGTDANATLGTYLIASNGMTLYTYAPDAANVSNCTGTCATNWPPYTVADASALANLQMGVTGTAGTITRADGTMQVTYNSHPLYFYIKDKVSGDATGQGVGGVWYVVAP